MLIGLISGFFILLKTLITDIKAKIPIKILLTAGENSNETGIKPKQTLKYVLALFDK